VIITPFASDLPAIRSELYTSQWFVCFLGHEMQGHQTRLPGLFAALMPEAYQTSRKRTTRRRVFRISVVDSQSGRPQRVGPAVEVL